MISLKLLKQCLKEKSRVSLLELQNHLQEDQDTIRSLLKYFIDRGQVIECALTGNCGNRCQKCPVNVTTLYEWAAY